jgi:hypothetical protein
MTGEEESIGLLVSFIYLLSLENKKDMSCHCKNLIQTTTSQIKTWYWRSTHPILLKVKWIVG